MQALLLGTPTLNPAPKPQPSALNPQPSTLNPQPLHLLLFVSSTEAKKPEGEGEGGAKVGETKPLALQLYILNIITINP